jgi:hypothetical protein
MKYEYNKSHDILVNQLKLDHLHYQYLHYIHIDQHHFVLHQELQVVQVFDYLQELYFVLYMVTAKIYKKNQTLRSSSIKLWLT